MFFSEYKEPKLSGERFSVIYKLSGNEKEAYEKAKDLCLEQTVEFPGELLPDGAIRDSIVGRIESFKKHDSMHYMATVSYAVETSSNELTQLLNVVFGNSSIKPGIRVEKLLLSDVILKNFKGPRFGRDGLREYLGIKNRPLLFTALKPMGLSSEALADLAYKFALGGIDLIKDDHGLSNQSFSPFEERVELCVNAINKANRETGGKSVYVPNITAPFSEMVDRARKAKELGAGGLLISPGLAGFDAMREISEDENINLPVFSHPAFLGTFVMSNETGISHGALLGQIMRLAGADATIYPNFGGRFSFSREECESIAVCTSEKMGNLKPIFPCPAGGMSLGSIPESLKVYGKDVIFLVGGGLFRHGPNLIENCAYFRKLIENIDLKEIF
ncbi:RuBisCO large subunit C-terminal-like domain-containing protein [Acetivibrio clariflavus]|uniref:Ribulose 1,5-bisphosphate carboxylase, large subunit n=1 Tax=Acetivibrio clariflavus (strain DSM 19732 / NBRC 101661 / EBR45) TaxID=720554 RepID=G8LZL2_ACECE|nr:RuBisCO large subunit C-terminal-like domain-containing protein [Acetivibrio clariflavus]AEV67913.1 ribulose 1,5-bisphosphate carboxylase, large subunit [Acetivibrio clariflavus DSM 19732]